MVETLLHLGADTETRDSFGYTPLFSAVTKKNIPAIKALIHRANLHVQVNSGQTLLEKATQIDAKIAHTIKKEMAFTTYWVCKEHLPIELIMHIASFYK